VRFFTLTPRRRHAMPPAVPPLKAKPLMRGPLRDVVMMMQPTAGIASAS